MVTTTTTMLSPAVSSPFEGDFVFDSEERYEEYLRILGVGWFSRKRALFLCPALRVRHQTSAGKLIFSGDHLNKGCQRSLVLGEEHNEPMPGGDFAKAITVGEGDSCLITRLCKGQRWGAIEIRREFSADGMIQFIRCPDADLEVTRIFKRKKKKCSK